MSTESTCEATCAAPEPEKDPCGGCPIHSCEVYVTQLENLISIFDKVGGFMKTEHQEYLRTARRFVDIYRSKYAKVK